MILVLAFLVAGQGKGRGLGQERGRTPLSAVHERSCGNAVRALRFYRGRYVHWTSLYHYGMRVRIDRIRPACSRALRAAIIWRAKSQEMQGAYLSEFRWRNWLPEKWRRVGVCETGLNWLHHNSTYTSAFGIGSEYDRDAAYEPDPDRGQSDVAFGFVKVQVRGWFRHPWPPSPWEQFQAAIGHYLRFGGLSGWGCGGA